MFTILYEDTHLIVLLKPAGLLSQGDHSGDENLVDFLRVRFGRNYVGLIHRLDRNTSGLMVVAKRSKSAERLSDQLQNGKLIRHYHALLHGTIPENSKQIWEHTLLKNESTNEVRVVKPGTAGGKIARLKVVSLKNFSTELHHAELTWARFELETGRSHQIRVQSAAMQHPLVGDAKYGAYVKRLNAKDPVNEQLFYRPALHSCYLSFEHPMTHEQLEFTDAIPVDLQSAFSTHLE